MAGGFAIVPDPDDGPDVSTASGAKICPGWVIDRQGWVLLKTWSFRHTVVICAVYRVHKPH